MVSLRGTIRLVGWCVALAATLLVLHRWSLPAAELDLTSRDPADLLPVLLRGGRWVALACAWYLTGATVLSVLTTVLAWRPLRRLETAVAVPAVRHLVRAGLGASLAVGLGIGPAAAAVEPPGPPGASARPAPLAELADRPTGGDPLDGPRPAADAPTRLPPPGVAPPPEVADAGAGDTAQPGVAGGAGGEDDDGVADGERTPQQRTPGAGPRLFAPEVARDDAREPISGRGPAGRSAPSGPVVDEHVAADAGVADTGAEDTRADGATGAETTTDGDTVAVGDVARTHVVVAGESFWSIAADLTADELGREPEDEDVFERWVVLIDANRDRLLVPDDPDLLLPGQELRLPEVGR